MEEKDFEKLIFGMAHQIRNPCAIILSNANLLKKLTLSKDEERSLDAIVNGVRYLETRLDEFVEFAKPLILNLQPILLDKLVQDAISLVNDKCQLKKIRITPLAEKNQMIQNVDTQQILVALLNVILNSIESIRSSGGQISIHGQSNDHLVKIEVKDNGCGIHPRDLPEVFSPFYSTKVGGIGIGLSVTKKIVDAHQGKIEMQSEFGAGTTVTIHLPNNIKG